MISRISTLVLGAGLLAVVAILVFGVIQRVTRPVTDPYRDTPIDFLIGDRIQVEVLNGVGVDGAAQFTADYLRSYGVDVVYVADFDSFGVSRTQVIDRTGIRRHADKIARMITTNVAAVETQVDSTRYVDVTAIIGDDLPTLRPFLQTQF